MFVWCSTTPSQFFSLSFWLRLAALDGSPIQYSEPAPESITRSAYGPQSSAPMMGYEMGLTSVMPAVSAAASNCAFTVCIDGSSP